LGTSRLQTAFPILPQAGTEGLADVAWEVPAAQPFGALMPSCRRRSGQGAGLWP